jgi:hypothetical protein
MKKDTFIQGATFLYKQKEYIYHPNSINPEIGYITHNDKPQTFVGIVTQMNNDKFELFTTIMSNVIVAEVDFIECVKLSNKDYALV